MDIFNEIILRFKWNILMLTWIKSNSQDISWQICWQNNVQQESQCLVQWFKFKYDNKYLCKLSCGINISKITK